MWTMGCCLPDHWKANNTSVKEMHWQSCSALDLDSCTTESPTSSLGWRPGISHALITPPPPFPLPPLCTKKLLGFSWCPSRVQDPSRSPLWHSRRWHGTEHHLARPHPSLPARSGCLRLPAAPRGALVRFSRWFMGRGMESGLKRNRLFQLFPLDTWVSGRAER